MKKYKIRDKNWRDNPQNYNIWMWVDSIDSYGEGYYGHLYSTIDDPKAAFISKVDLDLHIFRYWKLHSKTFLLENYELVEMKDE